MILLIDNYDSFTFNLQQQARRLHEDVLVVRNDRISFEEVFALEPSGIILSPGPGRPENSNVCLELIGNHKLLHVPLLGVCLGHQAIALRFGGRVVRAPRPVHGKVSPLLHSNEALFRGISQGAKMARYHSLIVDLETLPECLRLDAWTPDGLVMAISHNELPIFGVQFHPESFMSEQGDTLMENFIQIVRNQARSESWPATPNNDCLCK